MKVTTRVKRNGHPARQSSSPTSMAAGHQRPKPNHAKSSVSKAAANGVAKRQKNSPAPQQLSGRAAALSDAYFRSEDNNQYLEQDIRHGALHDDDELLRELEERGDADSICEDVIGSSVEDRFFPEIPGACTPAESMSLRRLLREIGPTEFIDRTVASGIFTVKKLLTAFSVRPPEFLEDGTDEDYLPFLSLAMTRELQKRAKLEQYNSIDDAVDLIRRSRNIIVLTGAGISTSLGIPDFRSKNTGLYAMLGDLGLDDPQQVFDLALFHEDPSIFYSIARKVLPKHDICSPTHAFIALLQQQGKLLTNYTQNIDNIEEVAGVDPEKLVQCHGSWKTATCIKCGYRVPGKAIFPVVEAGGIPRCPMCAAAGTGNNNNNNNNKNNKNSNNTAPTSTRPLYKSRRRRTGDESDDDSDGDYSGGKTNTPAPRRVSARTGLRAGSDRGDSGSEADASRRPVVKGEGIMKPDITFFGEQLPRRFGERLFGHDRDLVDLVIVIGTSLKVKPVSELVPVLPAHVPQIYISRDPVTHAHFDIDLLGDCDVVVAELCRRAGWDLRHEMVPPDQKLDISLEDGYMSRHRIVAVKSE